MKYTKYTKYKTQGQNVQLTPDDEEAMKPLHRQRFHHAV